MPKYLDYWKAKLKQIKSSFDNQGSNAIIDITDIQGIGDRKDYRGTVTFRFGKAVNNTEAQHIRDLIQAVSKSSGLRQYITNELMFRIDSEFRLSATYKRFSPEDLIAAYKGIIVNGNSDEIYKWHTLKRPLWDIEATDLAAMYKAIPFHNLIYHDARRVMLHIIPLYQEEIRELFKMLFTSEAALLSRIQEFRSGIETIYRRVEPNYNTHQDERTIATYLTYYDPERYTLYKEEFYSKYCKMLGIQTEQVNRKYAHYMELIEDFKKKYVDNDNELLQLVEDFKDVQCFSDDNHYLLTQDILYQTLVGTWEDDEDNIVSDELREKILSFNDPAAVRYFFSLLRKLIVKLELLPESPTLRLSDEPTNEYPIRLVAFLKRGLALQLYKQDDTCYIRKLLKSKEVPHVEGFFNKVVFSGTEILNVSASLKLWRKHNLEEKWLQGCEEYLLPQPTIL